MTEALVLRDVAIHLGPRQLIDGLSATIPPGGVLTLMGPSGCGKSTLLAWLGGFLDPVFTARGLARLGSVELLDLPAERRRLGLLFQDDLLFPHLSVGENLAFGLAAAVQGRAARRARVEEALASAGLAGHADRDPATLSGGQRARVALLRTLLAEPRALLLDEPFSKLDQAIRRDFRAFVFAHAAARRLPTVLVTHDPEDAAATGGPVITLGAAA